ncbi:MAG TPA: H-X9-DG-CTERM domain-containing protein [Tepidisphaeraceae bacterium]|jgi:prepilin-type processing-associated H-X9-DG protein
MKSKLYPRSAGMTLADLLVVLILVPLSVTAFIGCWQRTNSGGSNRVKCASNLRQIGQAILLYSNENRGAYPQTTFADGAVVIPTWGTGAKASNPFAAGGPEPNDVSAALFLLLRTQEITPEVFVCPSSNAEKWDLGGGSMTALNWSNWEGRDGMRSHLSYSYQNPYPDDAAVKAGFKLNNSISAEFAVAADINPGTSGGQNVLMVPMDASSRDMRRANSRNHDTDGQNVLFGDGHVEFVATAFCGVKRDMIYARRAGADGVKSSEVRNSPFDANDSVLLPTDE